MEFSTITYVCVNTLQWRNGNVSFLSIERNELVSA